MPFSSGSFSRLYNWVTDKAGGIKIRADRMDAEMDGMATALSTCILKDGTQTITAAIPFNSQNITGVGTLSGAAATLTGAVTGGTIIPSSSSAPTNGMYLPASNTLGFAVNSTGEVQLTSTALSPVTSDGNALGTSSLMWADAFFASGAVLNFNNGNVTVTHSAGALAVAGNLSVTGSIIGAAQPSFSAHKNGTDQTGIASLTNTKVTFTTEIFDTGGYYDAPNSKWTPPAGKVLIAAAARLDGLTSGSLPPAIVIYKNGAVFKLDSRALFGTISGMLVTLVDNANGTDYYEIYVVGTTGTSITCLGDTTYTWFTGAVI